MDPGDEYYARRLRFDDDIFKNIKITKKICNDEFYVKYGINVRKQLAMDVTRAKAGADLQKLVPKDVKCVFFDRCEGTEMPKLPDTVEVLYIQKCNFKKFYFPKSLKEMYFAYSPIIKTLPDLSNLKNLWSLDISGLVELRFLPKNLPESLVMLTMEENDKLKSSLSSLPSGLEYIHIKNCYNITKIPNFTYLKKLRQITLDYPREYKLNISKKIDPKLLDLFGNFQYKEI